MNRWCHITLFILAIAIAPQVEAQRLRDWIILGDQALKENDPYGALQYYGEAMKLDSSKAEVLYKYAEALRQNQKYAKAAYYYHKVYRRDYGKVYTEGPARLAAMQKQAGRYEAAKQTWRRVRNQYSEEPESYWYQKAVQEMRACDLAKAWTAETAPFTLEKTAGGVNTEASEFAGIFDNQNRLIFTSLRGTFDEQGRLISPADEYLPHLYIADSSFGNVKILPLPGNQNRAFNYSISAKGDKIAFATKRDNGQSKVMVYKVGKSTPVLTLPLVPDSFWYSQPAFGRVGEHEVLYFASNRPGGYGQEDIWYVYFDTLNAKPINAGNSINTPGSDMTPYYRMNTGELYFSSNWHYGLGGYDLFASYEVQGDFSFPENLKKPFNSPANDLYYSFNAHTAKGTITSNRGGSMAATAGSCCNDLWLFTEAKEAMKDSLPEIDSLEALNKYLPVRLYFHNDQPNPRTRAETTKLGYLETYRAYIKLLPKYEKEYRQGLSDDAGNKAEEAIDAFFRNSVDEGVKNLKLFTRLLAGELAEGQQIAITIKGFASPLAKTDYNVKLTSRRISSFVNYLKNFDRGVLKPYLDGTAENGGKLEIIKIPFGEYISSTIVSDNPNESNAIYSIAAAKERKIEIVSVQRATTDTALAELHFETEIIDFGRIRKSDTLTFTFTYEVVGGLKLDTITYNRNAISLTAAPTDTSDGTGKLTGTMHPAEFSGKQNLIIRILGNLPGGQKELNLTFEIAEKP